MLIGMTQHKGPVPHTVAGDTMAGLTRLGHELIRFPRAVETTCRRMKLHFSVQVRRSRLSTMLARTNYRGLART